MPKSIYISQAYANLLLSAANYAHVDIFHKTKIANCSVGMCSNAVSPYLACSVDNMGFSTSFCQIVFNYVLENVPPTQSFIIQGS